MDITGNPNSLIYYSSILSLVFFFYINIGFAVCISVVLLPECLKLLLDLLLLQPGILCPSCWWDAMEGAATLLPRDPSKFAHAETPFQFQEPRGGR